MTRATLLFLLAGSPACGGESGVSAVVAEKQKADDGRVARRAEERATAEAAIRAAVQAHLSLPDDLAATLIVEPMPNNAMGGAREPAAGMCFIAVLGSGEWKVVHAGSVIDERAVFLAYHQTAGSMRASADQASLIEWGRERCPGGG